ncbi:MAG: PASTA domain-containing protein [Muribaculaceae bacterium]|nr:PASTA domain-containing protein [Muribaculaceae bacterium]
MKKSNDSSKKENRGLISGHPVLANVFVILLVAVLGIWIVYISLQLFTKHGESDVVPKVENMSYSQAINVLHQHGFRVDIRDSIYKEDMKPGFVIEQFPKSGAVVKPGRKIFLYINAVHPKEVVIDDDNNPREDALKSFSFRQGMARLEELGFKNIRVVKVLGDNDCIVKVTANGRVVKKTQKVPVNAKIVVEVYDGRLGELRDSLQNEEYLRYSAETAADNSGIVTGDVGDEDQVPVVTRDEEPEETEPIFIE